MRQNRSQSQFQRAPSLSGLPPLQESSSPKLTSDDPDNLLQHIEQKQQKAISFKEKEHRRRSQVAQSENRKVAVYQSTTLPSIIERDTHVFPQQAVQEMKNAKLMIHFVDHKKR